MRKVKLMITVTVLVAGLIAAFTFKVEEDQYKGYTKMVERVYGNPDSGRSHNLDLSKYRPNINGQ